MTETPRTDARACKWTDLSGEWVDANVARELERELARERRDRNHALAERNTARIAAHRLARSIEIQYNQTGFIPKKQQRALAEWSIGLSDNAAGRPARIKPKTNCHD